MSHCRPCPSRILSMIASGRSKVGCVKIDVYFIVCSPILTNNIIHSARRSMPLPYLRKLTGKDRSATTNRQLGLSLAFVGGAANAGGFLAVGQYTSHMTGVVSAMADDLAL